MRSKIKSVLICNPVRKSYHLVYILTGLAILAACWLGIATESPADNTPKRAGHVFFPPVDINAISSTTPLEQFVFYLPDAQGTLDAKSAFSRTDQFIPLKQKPITFHTKSHWYAIHLFNSLNTQTHWFITTGVSTAPLLRAYWINTNEQINKNERANPQTEENSTQLINQDINLPKSSNETINFSAPNNYTLIESQIAYGFPTLLFTLPLQPNADGILLIEYQSLAHFPLTLHIYDSDHLLESTQRLKLANGIYIGAIGILFLFFFGQFLISRDKVYLYYSMFVLFAILIMMQISGPAQLFNQSSTSQAMITTLIGGGIYVFYFIFSAEFLPLKNRNKLLYRALVTLSGTVLGLTILGFFYPSAYALSIVIAIGLPWPIAGAIWAWRQKNSSAVFFLVGSLTHCVSTYFLLLACLGFTTFRNELIFRIACLGLMFDILCFAVAIIYQSNQVRLHYNRQLQERINDLNALAESEQISAKALSMSKQAVLNLAAAAHDLQQPLSAMQLLLSLQNSADPTVQNVQGALNYACSLLNSALGSARQDYQTFCESVDARMLLGTAKYRHEHKFAEKKLTLRLRCKPEPINCLPIVVNRILDNLLSNAYKYTSKGKILISGRRRLSGDFLIQIWDMGRGMDHKQVNKLTTPFERINDTEELGFGLGLFIVKSLCHQAGYIFSIRSKEHHGSCFSILIPENKTKHDWLEE
ncbi:MAG TPA: sensor histidine kinase [Cellvibrionaceae bacterium]